MRDTSTPNGSDVLPGPDWPAYGSTPPYVLIEHRAEGPRKAGRDRCELGSPLFNPGTGQTEGVFAHWTWDGARLTAQVDPLGFFSLFVYSKGPVVAVSPSLLQLVALGADTEPDTQARAVFRSLGMYINDDTPFRHIRTLPAGGRLTWENGTLTVTGGPHIPKPRVITRDAAVDGIIEMPRDSIRTILDHWPGAIVLPLSGGRDSRHILLEMDHLGRLPDACLTFQHSARGLDRETQAARAVCESVGATHHVLGRSRSAVRDTLRAMILTSLCSDEHRQMMPLHDHLRVTPAAALDGIAGDILTNPDSDAEAHFRRAEHGDYVGIARAMIAGHLGVITKPGAGGDGPVPPAVVEEATEYLGQTIEGFADATDPYQAFWFWNRTRREIGFCTSSIFATAQAVFTPFLDTRFVDFCLSLPYAVTRDRQLHNDAIARAYPRHAGVPYAEGFAPPAHAHGGLASRITKAAIGAKTIHALHPDRPLAEMMTFLRGTGPLYRGPAETSQLYGIVLKRIDAGFAGDLLALGAHYRQAERSDQVSEIYEPAGANDHQSA